MTHIENHPLVGRRGGPERPELGRKPSLIRDKRGGKKRQKGSAVGSEPSELEE